MGRETFRLLWTLRSFGDVVPLTDSPYALRIYAMTSRDLVPSKSALPIIVDAPLPEAPSPLSVQDYEAIKRVLGSTRNILLCQVLRTTGLRISEVLALTPTHLREEGPRFYILVRRGKKKGGDRQYERVYLHPTLGAFLKDYCRGNQIEANSPIFAIGRRMVEYIFEKAGLEAIGRKVHPHEFRHLYTRTLIDGGIPVEAAAKMLGHDNPATTLKWYYELTNDKRAAIQERIPL